MGKAARLVRGTIQQEFVKKFEALSGRYSIRQIWEDWVIMAAISISNAVDLQHAPDREKHYMALAGKYSNQELGVFAELFTDFINAMEVNPDQDFLGDMYMAVGMGNEHAGQFFTPYSICKAMAKMTAPDIPGEIQKRGWLSVNDPACGAGALLVAFANECLLQNVNYQTSVLFVAQDIDYIVGCMCYLQLSILGCPGYVKIGDTLARPSTAHDPYGLLPVDDGNIWYTPFYFREEWNTRRLAAMMALTFSRISTEAVPAEMPAVADPAPLQPVPEPEKPQATVTISPEPERAKEREELVYQANDAGQLMLF